MPDTRLFSSKPTRARDPYLAGGERALFVRVSYTEKLNRDLLREGRQRDSPYPKTQQEKKNKNQAHILFGYPVCHSPLNTLRKHAIQLNLGGAQLWPKCVFRFSIPGSSDLDSASKAQGREKRDLNNVAQVALTPGWSLSTVIRGRSSETAH